MSIPHSERGDAALVPQHTIDLETGEVLPHAEAQHRTRSVFERSGGAHGGAAAVASEAQPPVGNTGVHRSRVSLVGTAINCDWWSETIHADFEQVREVLETVGLGALEKLDGGSRFCLEVYVGLYGLRVEAVPRDPKQSWVAWSLPGECCHWLGADGIKKLQDRLWLLHMETGCKLNCTRWDMAADTQSFEAEWFARLAERDDKAARAGRPEREIERRSEAFHVERSEGGGCTVYLGAPTSEQRLVVYHKLDGDTFGAGVAFTRVEQRWRGHTAQVVASMFAAAPLEDWPTLTAGLLNQFALVKKRWWRSFVGTLEKAALVVHRARSTVAKAKAWLLRSVAPTLALVVDAESTISMTWGRLFIEALLENGRERRSSVGRSRVAHNQAAGLPAFAIFNVGGTV